jgi:hypothetical protein
MRASSSSNLPAPLTVASLPEGISSYTRALSDKVPILDSRAGETFDAANTRTSEIHLETSPSPPLGAGFAGVPCSSFAATLSCPDRVCRSGGKMGRDRVMGQNRH